MSEEKRSVATDALATLGSIIGTEEKRDAIHLAVEPAVAAYSLKPGDDVGFVEGGLFGYSKTPLGIVDPFLKSYVKPGERFWLIVYPRQIKSLRHVWEHPGFPNEPATPVATVKAESQLYLERVAANVGRTYDDLISHLRDAASGAKYGLYSNNEDNYDGKEEMWDHYENITGEKVDPEYRDETWFSCSC